MPRDTQIVRAAPVAAPKDFTVDSNVELILREVHANFVDNGAASDWLPCVDLISDSGHTIARCCDPNVKVTAGDDAEVTWFPGVKPPTSGAAPASTVVMPWVTATVDNWTWVNNVLTAVDFSGGTVTTSDTSVFVNNLGSDTTAPIKILKNGIYLSWLGVGDWNAAWGTQALIEGDGVIAGFMPDGFTVPTFPLSFTPVGANTFQLTSSSAGRLFGVEPLNQVLRISALQNSGANRIQSAFISVVRLTANAVGH